MKIDCHTHVLNENSFNEYMEKYKTDMLLCIRFFEGFCGGIFKDRDAEFEKLITNHDNLYIIESIDFDINILSQLEQLKEEMKNTDRIKGIKLYPGYQHFQPYHERLFPVYNFAGEIGLPVVFHSGALYEYENSQALLKYTNPILIDEVAVKYPGTKFVISHFGFPYLQETAMVVNKNNNVYTDVSGVVDETECYKAFKDDLKKILRYYPDLAPQIMFGTDFTGNDTILSEVNLYVKLVEELFSGEYKDMVFYKNAQKVYNIK